MPPTKSSAISRPKPSSPDGRKQRKPITEALQRLARETETLQRLAREIEGNGPGVELEEPHRALSRAAATATAVGTQIQIWEDDPFLEAVAGAAPVLADPITVDTPENDQPLQTQIREQQPPPEIYPLESPEFLYWNAAAALARGINYWSPLLPDGTKWSSAQDPLQVELDEGVDFNAFYARESGLNFFHGDVDRVDPQVRVFSGESPDVVCHELGHAILDAVKPELFDAMSNEVAAFHEAFADCSAMLSALQLPTIRDTVLSQTGGILNRNSRLSQTARQLGWAIRVEIDPSAVDTDALRNACNKFFYQDPSTLPPSAPATQLSSEAHSFSRVFSGAFLDVLAKMFQVGPASSAPSDSAKLEATARDAGKLLIEGVRLASVGSGFYSQVAAGMVQADQTLNGGHYRAALTSSFIQRGILSPTAAVALVRDLQSHRGLAFGVSGLVPGARQLQFEGDNEGYKHTGKDAPALPVRPLTTRFGVSFHVHMPAEPNRFGVAGASLTGGSERTFSPEEDARSYAEDLVQQDRICHAAAPDVIPSEFTTPGETGPCAKTHRLVREDGKVVLKRHHFMCGFAGCRHGR